MVLTLIHESMPNSYQLISNELYQIKQIALK